MDFLKLEFVFINADKKVILVPFCCHIYYNSPLMIGFMRYKNNFRVHTSALSVSVLILPRLLENPNPTNIAFSSLENYTLLLSESMAK